MSIFHVADIINEIKQYCNDKSLVSFLLTCKTSTYYLKNFRKEVHNQALDRELNHCTRTNNVKINDRLCNSIYNFRVLKANTLYAAKTDIYGNIIGKKCYKLHVKYGNIELKKYTNVFLSVTYGILLYVDGPIVTSKLSPYLKYKTVPRNMHNVTPELNMMVTVQHKVTGFIHQYYIKSMDNNTLVLGPCDFVYDIISFDVIRAHWYTNSKFLIVKFGGFI